MATTTVPYPNSVKAAPPAISAVDPVWLAAEANPLRKQIFYFSLLYIFLRFSLMHEAFAILTGVNIRPAVLFGLPTVLGVLMTGGVTRVLRSRIGWMWLGFCVMMVASTPFSSWPGGSVDHLIVYFKSEITMLLVMGGLAATWREIKLLFATLTASALFSVVMSKALLKQVDADGRMELDIPGSSIANSNDMAAHMLLLLPFLLLMIFRPGRGVMRRLIGIAASLTSLYVILGSGSRGALVALVVMGAVLFLQAKGIHKLMIVILVPLLGFLIYGALPRQVQERLFNFDQSWQDENSARSEAAGSLMIRNELMKNALLYTIQNPILGIGPGQFPVYDDRVSRAQGKRRGSWHNPHIVYLQVSSECGIPAFLLFMGAIGGSLLGVYRLTKRLQGAPELKELLSVTQTLLLAMIGFYTAIFFLPIAYKMLLPALSGLAISIMFVSHKELVKLQSRPNVAAGSQGVQASGAKPTMWATPSPTGMNRLTRPRLGMLR